jgi:uncharacterized Zn finger protein (UPF0148 family)
MDITADQLSKFLNEKTGGFCCPICHKTNWFVKVLKNQKVKVDEIQDANYETMQKVLAELTEEYGGTVPQNGEPEDFSLMSRVIILRCNQCGWLAPFDAQYVKEQIYEERR